MKQYQEHIINVIYPVVPTLYDYLFKGRLKKQNKKKIGVHCCIITSKTCSFVIQTQNSL